MWRALRFWLHRRFYTRPACQVCGVQDREFLTLWGTVNEPTYLCRYHQH